ncbi:MAG: hypothetical protein ACT4O2_08720, partial [Beijerinckiaceae bacterium]
MKYHADEQAGIVPMSRVEDVKGLKVCAPASRSAWIHSCPVGFGWTRRMALIQLGSEDLANHSDTKKDQRHAASEYRF